MNASKKNTDEGLRGLNDRCVGLNDDSSKGTCAGWCHRRQSAGRCCSCNGCNVVREAPKVAVGGQHGAHCCVGGPKSYHRGAAGWLVGWLPGHAPCAKKKATGAQSTSKGGAPKQGGNRVEGKKQDAKYFTKAAKRDDGRWKCDTQTEPSNACFSTSYARYITCHERGR